MMILELLTENYIQISNLLKSKNISVITDYTKDIFFNNKTDELLFDIDSLDPESSFESQLEKTQEIIDKLNNI